MAESDNINDETCVSPHTDPSAKNLMDLPTELHIHISSFLSYPDALALKHTSRLFYLVVDTGVELKIDWLVERFERKLECPMEKCGGILSVDVAKEAVLSSMGKAIWRNEVLIFGALFIFWTLLWSIFTRVLLNKHADSPSLLNPFYLSWL
ncbi:uncharacterized protein TRUGW13939_08933 [Talaromyces rugulosus]|uniref:F-box domain-containing protein n=1 Tax=Talaromyces rugulosus TaxID=121627 RepID=A0A7H8R6D2_TALRU|nr:uncharacterized protein TRUGW13939_08933 [Talaromyces rugulosus]QKX61777.1 hypothetical protein TRUGW13939_08933 [Talaromyces rugulosus]